MALAGGRRAFRIARHGVHRGHSRAYDRTVPFPRITVDHRVMGGVPCIRGTRIPVATLVGMVAEGMTTTEILDDFPQLSAEDVQEALRYAAVAVAEAPSRLPVQM